MRDGTCEIQAVVAGAGGQGVVSMSYLLAHIGMARGYHVSWFPSYGAEMRGGTATCLVVVSKDEVSSPIFEWATHGVILNTPSFRKHEAKLVAEGVVIVDADLVDGGPSREDLVFVPVPAQTIAGQAGNPRSANMAMLGALLAHSGLGESTDLESHIKTVLPKRHWKHIPANIEAARRGAEFVRERKPE